MSKGMLDNVNPRCFNGIDQRSLYFNAGGDSPGVKDSRMRMASLSSEREGPCISTVKDRS